MRRDNPIFALPSTPNRIVDLPPDTFMGDGGTEGEGENLCLLGDAPFATATDISHPAVQLGAIRRQG